MLQAPRPATVARRPGLTIRTEFQAARMIKRILTKKFDGLPPALVRPHLIRRGNILGIFD
jgi:hypothetical protein